MSHDTIIWCPQVKFPSLPPFSPRPHESWFPTQELRIPLLSPFIRQYESTYFKSSHQPVAPCYKQINPIYKGDLDVEHRTVVENIVTTYNARTFLYRWSWWPFWGKHRVGKFPFLKTPKKIQLRDNRIWDFASGLNTMAQSKSATMHCMMNASIAYCKKRKVWISCFLGDLRPNHQIFWSRKLWSLTLNGTEWRNTPWSSLSYLD